MKATGTFPWPSSVLRKAPAPTDGNPQQVTLIPQAKTTLKPRRPWQGWSRSARWLTAHSEAAFLLFLAGFLFLVATNTQAGWLYVVTALLLGLLVAGHRGPRTALRGLRIRCRMPAPARQGDLVDLEVELENRAARDRLLLTVEVMLPESLPGTPSRHRVLIERLPAGQSLRIRQAVACTVRGYHHLPAITLRTGAPLGLFQHTVTFEVGQSPLVVYPRGPHLAESTRTHLSRNPALQRNTTPRPGSSEDFLGLRPYQTGEDTRFIHWPATARTGQIMLREFRGQTGQGRTVLVDNPAHWVAGTPDESNLEAAIEAAAALVDQARRQGIPLTLLGQQGDRLVNVRGSGEAALDLLARLEPSGHLTWPEVLARLNLMVADRSDLFVLTCRPLDQGLDLAALTQGRQALQAVFFPPPRRPDSELEAYEASAARIRAAGFPAQVHHRGADLARTLTEGLRP